MYAYARTHARAAQRFGIEGCEALLPGLRALVSRCAQHGVERLEVGMPVRVPCACACACACAAQHAPTAIGGSQAAAHETRL